MGQIAHARAHIHSIHFLGIKSNVYFSSSRKRWKKTRLDHTIAHSNVSNDIVTFKYESTDIPNVS